MKGEEFGGHKYRVSRPQTYFPVTIHLSIFKTDDVLDAVAKVFGVTPADLQTHSNAAYYSKPRAMAMYIMRSALGMSLPMIARRVAGVHHTTVMYQLKRVKQQMELSEDYRETVNGLVAHFSQTREDLA